MRRIRVLVGLAAAVVVTAWSGPVLAEPDAGLRLHVDAAPSFVVGSQGTIDDFCTGASPYSRAQASLAFHATSPSGIVGYDVRALYAGQPPDPPQHLESGPVRWQIDNYDAGCGGGSFEQIGWRVIARDGAGHSVAVERVLGFTIKRWANGFSYGQNRDRWSFSPGWTKSTCACADGGSQNYSTRTGRSGTYLAHATAGEHLGLMMATGPGRGKAHVFLDGTRVAMVDTFSPSNNNRVYVWDSGPLAAGDHVVRVVNQATTGRPRIDVNAMGVLQ